VFIWLSAIAILVIILAIVAVIILLTVGSGGIINNNPETYYTIKPRIQNAVFAYMLDHNGSLPPCEDTPFDIYDTHFNTTITCYVIDICSLIDTLKLVPEGCYGDTSQEHTNFYNSSDAHYKGGCKNPNKDRGHYIWLVDSKGNISSICDENRDGVYNDTDRTDGKHQNIWP